MLILLPFVCWASVPVWAAARLACSDDCLLRLKRLFPEYRGFVQYSTITKWTPRRKRGTFLGFWTFLTTLAVQAQLVWHCSAQIPVRWSCHRHVYFPVDYRADFGFIGLRYGSDSPESYGLGKLKSCSARRSAKRTKRQNLPIDQVADLC